MLGSLKARYGVSIAYAGLEEKLAFVKKLSEANPQMKPLLERILSKKALQDMSEPIFAALPGGKKTKGNEWTRDTSLDMGPIGSYTTKYTYTYGEPDKDKNEKITVKTDLKYKAPADDKAANLPFRIKSATGSAPLQSR